MTELYIQYSLRLYKRNPNLNSALGFQTFRIYLYYLSPVCLALPFTHYVSLAHPFLWSSSKVIRPMSLSCNQNLEKLIPLFCTVSNPRHS